MYVVVLNLCRCIKLKIKEKIIISRIFISVFSRSEHIHSTIPHRAHSSNHAISKTYIEQFMTEVTVTDHRFARMPLFSNALIFVTSFKIKRKPYLEIIPLRKSLRIGKRMSTAGRWSAVCSRLMRLSRPYKPPTPLT